MQFFCTIKIKKVGAFKGFNALVFFLLVIGTSLFLPQTASADVTDWTALTPGTSTGIKFSTTNANSVAYGNGTFVAVGASGKASYSTDGINWTELVAGASTGIKFGTTNATSVAYGGDKFVVVGASGKASYSTDGINWTVLTAGASSGIRFSTTQANSITYGGGKFVVVGQSGKASYSTDGINWTVLTAGDATGIKFGSSTAFSVAYGNGTFVAVGPAVLVSVVGIATYTKTSYSTDGVTWTASSLDSQSDGSSRDAYTVIYGGDKFVLAGESGMSFSSTNGSTWTSRTINFGTTDVLSLAYGDGTYMAVGSSGKASYSTNGTSWTALPVSTHDGTWFGTTSVNGAAYGGDKFVVVGASGKASYTSVVDPDGPTVSLPSVSAVGTNTATFTGELTSLGVSASVDVYFEWWTTSSSSVVQTTIPQSKSGTGTFTVDLSGLVPETAYQFRAVAKYTNVNGERTVHSSLVDFTTNMVTDEEGWVALPAGTSTGIKFGTTSAASVAYGNGTFVAVGASGKASYATDGINWTELVAGTSTGIKFSTTSAASVAYGNGTFVVGGAAGKASYSTDGINWTELVAGASTGIKFGTTTAVNSIAYGNGTFVAVGASGKASYSTDGVNWTELVAGTSTGIKFSTTNANSVAYGNGTFVAVGASGKASYSTDGINWTELVAGASTGIKFGTTNATSVAYGGDKFVVVGASGKASYSTDGINWTELVAGASTGIKFSTTQANSIAYGNGTFVAVGVSGKASYSTDGINWNILTPGNGTGIRFGTIAVNSVAYGNGTFVAVGASGKASYKITDAPTFSPPTITTEAATSLTQVTAILNGELASLGDTTSVNVYFEYGIGDFANSTTPETLSGTGNFDFEVTGLSPDTEYQFRAVAEYEDGGTQTVTGSMLTFTTEAAPTAPDAPTSLEATTESSTEVSLLWNAPLQDGGSAITGYQIERSTDGIGGWSQIGTTNAVTTVYEDGGLNSNTEYFYRVIAVNAVGSSSPSNTDSAMTDAEAPTADTELATSVTDTTATLNASIDLKDYGSANAYFEYGIGGFISITMSRGVNVSGSFTEDIAGLTNDSLYQVRLVIEYENGGTQIVYGDTETFTTDATPEPATEPGSPTGLLATAESATLINLTWAAPVDDGGATITEYRIDRSPSGLGSWTQIGTTDGDTREYDDSALSANTEYFYRVKAVNSEGVSAASNVASAITDAEDTTPTPEPEEPEPEDLRVYNVSSEVGEDWIRITWKTNREADSRVRYGMDQDLKEEKEETGNREKHSLTLRNLSPGTPYYFRVASEDKDGDDDRSRIYSVTTAQYVNTGVSNLTTVPLVQTPSLPQYEDVKVETNQSEEEKTLLENLSESKPSQTFEFFETQAYEKEGLQYINEVKFQIIDEQGKPLSYHPVTLHSEPRTSITDENGIVTFTNVPTGDHHLIFAYQDREIKKGINIANVEDVNAPLRSQITVVSVVKDPLPVWVWLSLAAFTVVTIFLLLTLYRQRTVIRNKEQKRGD